MAAAATNSSTFPLFLSLPQELRNQIWRDALPGKVGPALYFYRKGCWCPRRLSKSDEGYDTENDENNLNFEFRHDLLDDIQFEIPLGFVNAEARDISLAWVREQGIEIRPRKDRQYPVFVRPFDPMRDTLYVALDKWDDFLCEPDDRLSQPDLFEQLVDIKPDVTRIAVPEVLLQSEVATLPEMFRYFSNLKVLYIIVDAQPDLQSADNDMKVQRWWEFESTQGGAFFWDGDRGGFDSGNSEYIGDEALYRLSEEANKGLGEGLAKNHIRSFETRPAFAVRR
ncbi:MAG: hypothetical protein LQ347_004030 [Umbilicaria vellea]|nr:MAG: hypothetical protein LQ347_004030 [Umbilicaria vellea]